MKIERSFVFAFKAPNARRKLLIGGAYSFLFFTVFFAFVVIGYLMNIFCAALEGRDARLPEWNDLKALFHEGAQPVLIILAYNAPLILFYLVLIEIQVASVSPFAGFYLWPIELILMIAVSFLLPLALIRYIVLKSLRSAFEMGPILQFIKDNKKIYLKVWLLALAANVAVGFTCLLILAAVGLVYLAVGMAALVVGLGIAACVACFSIFIANVIIVHLFAQAYRSSTPFIDDQEGEIRASMAVPPPLRERLFR
ncbi:MAG: DUF4013 domain-containing protein [Myxococcota bacterium]|nr:DUF4013 domain-containing protein [Myxococcota bacterium]